MLTDNLTNATVWWKDKSPRLPYSEPNLDLIEKFLKQVDEANAILKQAGEDHRFKLQMKPPQDVEGTDRYRQFKRHASPNQVRKAIKNGYRDIDLWLHVNPVFYDHVYKKRDTTLKYSSNWSIDLDGYHDYGNRVNCVDQLIAVLNKRKAPLPYMIIQTSKFGFHLLYTGPNQYWCLERREDTLNKIADLREKPPTKEGYRMVLRNRGIDPHLINNFSHQTCRVPGSVNSKYQGACGVWYNENYQFASGLLFCDKAKKPAPTEGSLFLEDVQQEINVAVMVDMEAVLERRRKVAVALYNQTKDTIYNKLKPIIISSEEDAIDVWSEYFANNITFLKNGALSISQSKLAELFNVKQPTISRHIRRLLNSGVLEVKQEHIYNGPNHPSNKCKTYGFSQEFMKEIGILAEVDQASLIEELVAQPYERGNTHKRYLDDIQKLVYAGVDVLDACYIISTKFMKVRRQSRVPFYRIKKTFEDWQKHVKKNHWIPDKPIVDVENLKRIV